jgi:CarD family transcriptional regulator
MFHIHFGDNGMALSSHNFRSGDIVVYPSHGIGTVVGTRSERISHQVTELLVVALEVGMTLRIPLANIARCGLRGISSADEMRDALSALSERPSQKKTMWRQRAVEYAAKMKTARPRAIAEIVRDLYRAPGQTEGSFSEKAIYQQAWDHLIPELAAVDRTDKDAAARKVTELLEAA